MFREVALSEIPSAGFLHSEVEEVLYNEDKNTFIIKLTGADLKLGGALVDCTIAITDWWDLEVTEKGSKINHKYSLDDIPTDIEQIVKYTFEEGVLTLKACGYLDIDSNIYYKFTKPKIQITGEYDPD